MMMLWDAFVLSWWILFPAYAANMFPPFAKGRHPVDFGANFFDGKRLLGDGKTFEGLALGLLAGTLVGGLEACTRPFWNTIAGQYGAVMPTMTIWVGFTIALGALLGDMAGSFIKRRLSIGRGGNAPLLDQLNFIFGAIALSYWFTEISIWMMLFMFLLTPLIHRLSNIIGYKIKVKSVPW